MFTGIVAELGEVEALELTDSWGRLTVRHGDLGEIEPGESIAVNGCCLTVADHTAGSFTADVMAETLARTTLGTLRPGSRVNLERATTPISRLGGHLVQGHIDGVGTISERQHTPRWDVVTVMLPETLLRYVALKGSIAVDGVSLTVSALCDDDSSFEVSLIPTTLALTTLGFRTPGDTVNLEVDVIAKYVERLLIPNAKDG